MSRKNIESEVLPSVVVVDVENLPSEVLPVPDDDAEEVREPSEFLPLQDPQDAETQVFSQSITVGPIWCPVPVGAHRDIIEAALKYNIKKVQLFHQDDTLIPRALIPLGFYYDENGKPSSVAVTPLVILCQQLVEYYKRNDYRMSDDEVAHFRWLIEHYKKQKVGADGVHPLNLGEEDSALSCFKKISQQYGGKNDSNFCRVMEFLESACLEVIPNTVTAAAAKEKPSENTDSGGCCFCYFWKSWKKKPAPALPQKNGLCSENGSQYNSYL